MREVLRGFSAAALDTAGRERRLDQVVSGLEALGRAIVESEPLRLVLTDGGIPVAERRGVVHDLLHESGYGEAAALVAYAVRAERPTDLPGVIAQLRDVADDARRRAPGASPESEPQASRAAVRERIRGYVEFDLAQVANLAEVDVIEDECFRFARVVESSRELRDALSDPELPLAARLAILGDLLRGKVRPGTERLLGYVLRAGRVRDVVRAFDWVVEVTAEERGRRIAEVRTAVELDETQKQRLGAALARIAGRPVEVRSAVDAGVIGGMIVRVGDTVIDGTVRNRLEQLREALGAAGTPAA